LIFTLGYLLSGARGTPGCSFFVGRALSLLDKHDVDQACVTIGRHGNRMPTFLTTGESHLSQFSHRGQAPSVPINSFQKYVFHDSFTTTITYTKPAKIKTN